MRTDASLSVGEVSFSTRFIVGSVSAFPWAFFRGGEFCATRMVCAFAFGWNDSTVESAAVEFRGAELLSDDVQPKTVTTMTQVALVENKFINAPK